MTPLLSCVCAALQTLCTFEVEGSGPVRFGLPLPAEQLARGLRLEAEPGAKMQWAPLQSSPGFGQERVWVEVCVVGAQGRVRLAAGGSGPERDAGPACRLFREQPAAEEADRTLLRRIWDDGSVDTLERLRYADADSQSGCTAGEAETILSRHWLARRSAVTIPRRWWQRAGIFSRGQDRRATKWRAELIGSLRRLPQAPGVRGRGDFMRGDVVTNLEFDTAFALIRLGLITEDGAVLERAWYSARHLIDHDLDRRSGLPFVHGSDHRSALPEPGHVWIRGLLLTGLCFADHDLIEASRGMARALAQRVAGSKAKQGRGDRMRDEAWPLWELESYLRFEDLPPIRRAADRLASRIIDRWDADLGVLRYGEGELRGGYYRQRLWLSLGIAVPALLSHAERSGDDRATAIVDALRERAVTLLTTGASGVPLQVLVGPQGVTRQTRRQAAAESFMLLDGLSAKQRKRWLPRMEADLDAVLEGEPIDLATRWTIIGRCDWVME